MAGSKDENKDKDSAAAAATSQRENFLAVFYWSCLLFIWGCLVFLGFTCVRAITEAEGSTVELNNAARRRYLGARIARFNKELIDSRDPSVSLVGGTLTWQNSTDLMRCLLRRSAQAMLSVHYAVLYGTKLGFVDLPVKQNWENGPVLQFGRGADEDYCSPFTWDRAGFLTSIDLPGSIGRYEPQDVVYFEKSCLTELPADLMNSNSYEFTDERIRHFSMHYDRSKCSLYHADDPVTTQGLHNFVLYMTDLAITLAEAPDKARTDGWHIHSGWCVVCLRHCRGPPPVCFPWSQDRGSHDGEGWLEPVGESLCQQGAGDKGAHGLEEDSRGDPQGYR